MDERTELFLGEEIVPFRHLLRTAYQSHLVHIGNCRDHLVQLVRAGFRSFRHPQLLTSKKYHTVSNIL